MNTKIQAVLDSAALNQTELVALAIAALQEAGVAIEEPGDPVPIAIAKSSTYRFEVAQEDGLVVTNLL